MGSNKQQKATNVNRMFVANVTNNEIQNGARFRRERIKFLPRAPRRAPFPSSAVTLRQFVDLMVNKNDYVFIIFE